MKINTTLDPRKSYSSKVALGFVAVLIVGAVVGGFMFTTIDSEVRTDQEASLEEQSKIQANFTDTNLQQELGFTEEIANALESEPDLGNLETELSALSIDEDIRRMHYADVGGEVRASSDAGDFGKIVATSDPGKFRNKQLGNMGYQGARQVWNTQEPIVFFRQDGDQSSWVFMAPLDHQGTDGVLVREFTATAFLDTLDTVVPDSQTRLVNADGTVVLDTENPEMIGKSHVEDGRSPAVKNALDGTSGVTTLGGDKAGAGQKAVVSYDQTENGWAVVSFAEPSHLYNLASSVRQHLFLLLGAFGLMLLAFALVIERPTVKSISELTDDAAELRDGNLDTEIQSSRDDDLGELFETFDAMRTKLKDRIEEAEKAQREAEVARVEAEELANHLQKKADEYSEVMQDVSNGDMTQRMSGDREESMDRIAEEFNDMVNELEKTTGQLQGYVDEVEESGAEVEQSALTVREASEQVADSIQKISDDAYEQQEQIEVIIEDLNRIAAMAAELETRYSDTQMQKMSEQLEQTAGQLDTVEELTSQTMTEAEEVAGAAEEQAAELNAVSERANALQRYARPLRDILGRFQTEQEHEFVFSVGPTEMSSPQQDDD
ncbi:HAMP domain-containing protein [Halovenus rubra]|uniref:HAMP domain-containing protein n=2 Tax=Halovenus rubra TaxID=869890 RepID=A0ACC7E242_9EURY|nr:methyl-accepting chemotaxis protein [Halovenus rubra]